MPELTNIKSDTAYFVSDGLAWRNVDSDVFVFKPGGSLHVLEGPVAQLLWCTLDKQACSPDQLTEVVVQNFNVGAQDAAQDVTEFFGVLAEQGLIIANHP
ncbi:MAG: hypothetical protein CMH54_01170 [Myxococcales bacterium]|nr:hypothetical protein [Myxococcales bacterium]|tara:strand:+ start:2865 stop:3164 length:300 start_codon:yes stop_codon:yes gene_type:complete